ncbi:hypothetical protein INT45_012136 [Circinella minor]|uniref:Uncharacterized protein n=1 Tax=Circinella minor TaxID=1195481 RepID=A0A8H7SA96_9FUNG|nr:hypothetical protein INT45_012136 [Circinella minor]
MLTHQQEDQQKHQPVLPSFHTFCKTIEEQTPPPTPAPTSIIHNNIDQRHSNNRNTKNHIRTTSMPTRLPSQQIELQQKQRLSLEVLLDAIELDQSMYDAYQHEWSKTNIIRSTQVQDYQQNHQRNAATAAIAACRRKRSKSAPGIPRWRTPYSAPKCRNVSVQQIAESIVQKHIEYARKK